MDFLQFYSLQRYDCNRESVVFVVKALDTFPVESRLV